MANYPNLEDHLRSSLAWEFGQGAVDLRHVRNFVSSPRLSSFAVQAFSHSALVAAGDSYLDGLTMLADYPQKTWAMGISEFNHLVGLVDFVDEYCPRDGSVMKLQIWPFDPKSLDDFAMTVAVALSYTPAELMAESRISLAIDELVSKWNFYADGF